MRSEMLENYVALSITNILAMLLLAFVVGRNNLLDRKMKRFFFLCHFLHDTCHPCGNRNLCFWTAGCLF